MAHQPANVLNVPAQCKQIGFIQCLKIGFCDVGFTDRIQKDFDRHWQKLGSHTANICYESDG